MDIGRWGWEEKFEKIGTLFWGVELGLVVGGNRLFDECGKNGFG